MDWVVASLAGAVAKTYAEAGGQESPWRGEK